MVWCLVSSFGAGTRVKDRMRPITLQFVQGNGQNTFDPLTYTAASAKCTSTLPVPPAAARPSQLLLFADLDNNLKLVRKRPPDLVLFCLIFAGCKQHFGPLFTKHKTESYFLKTTLSCKGGSNSSRRCEHAVRSRGHTGAAAEASSPNRTVRGCLHQAERASLKQWGRLSDRQLLQASGTVADQ